LSHNQQAHFRVLNVKDQNLGALSSRALVFPRNSLQNSLQRRIKGDYWPKN